MNRAAHTTCVGATQCAHGHREPACMLDTVLDHGGRRTPFCKSWDGSSCGASGSRIATSTDASKQRASRDTAARRGRMATCRRGHPSGGRRYDKDERRTRGTCRSTVGRFLGPDLTIVDVVVARAWVVPAPLPQPPVRCEVGVVAAVGQKVDRHCRKVPRARRRLGHDSARGLMVRVLW